MTTTTKIRKATIDDAASIAEVHAESWRSTYAGIVPADLLKRRTAERLTPWWRQNLEQISAENTTSAVFVAEEPQGQLVGFVSAGQERTQDATYTGEIFAIYLFEHAQGSGSGRVLFDEATKWLRNAGHQAMMLWVLADNSSRGFYEHIGGQYLREQQIEIGGASLRELAYGWTI